MANYETVSAKITVELKGKIIKYKIPVSETIRQALEEKVKRREIEELEKRAAKLKPLIDKITTGDVVKTIREDRDKR
jgi:hypothetical protein